MKSMYNRYVPGHNGIYERITVSDVVSQKQSNVEPVIETPTCEPEEKTKQQHRPREARQPGPDLGDILLLCIVMLLLIDSDEEETLPLLIMAAAFLLQQ